MNSPRLFASITLLASIVCLSFAGGCKNNNDPNAAAMRGSALDVSPAPVAASPAPQAYTPAPAPAPAAQPVVYDSAPAAAPAAPVSASTSGGSYTVKRGDTLYSIAKSHYGSGKEYSRIVAANPGVSPDKLRVGQTITLP